MPTEEASPLLPFAGTYPEDRHFWVPPADAARYPLRWGDLFSTPADAQCRDSRNRPWVAAMAIHPSCELGSKGAPIGVQVVRVHRLSEVSRGQRDEIRAGFREVDGQVRISRVNHVYLAPVPGHPDLDRELMADLRATARVALDDLRDLRAAATTHDARVAALARDLYFRYRWPVTPRDVARLERERIGRDPTFVGPRPSWAPGRRGTTGHQGGAPPVQA